MEIDKPIVVALLAMEQSNFCYKACCKCETPIPETTPSNPVCNSCNACPNPSKRLFRVLFSIAADTQVFTVVCFDRDAKVIFGCSAQQFFDFVTQHPDAAKNASVALEGELLRIILTKPKRGKAEHLRMTSVVPLRTGFQPVIETLKEFYKAGAKWT